MSADQHHDQNGDDSPDDSSEADDKLELLQEKTGSEVLEKGTPPLISFRKDNTIAPNSTAAEEFFAGHESVVFAHDEDTNELWMVPRDTHDPDDDRQYKLPDEIDGYFNITSKPIFNKVGLDLDGTYRYSPDWDDEIEAVRIDLDQEPEEYRQD